MKSFRLAPSKDSFKLTRKSKSIEKVIPEENVIPGISDIPDMPLAEEEPESNVKDFNKRGFLKVLGMTGIGLAATFLFPKKADALILGGTPTSSVVGVKNAANARVNPATEETVSSLLKTSDLALDAGSLMVGVKNAANARVNPATEETVSSLLKTSDLTFDAGSLQVKVTSIPSTGSSSFSDSGDVVKSGLVDADRHVQVDVLSSTLPASASTENTLQTLSFGGYKFSLRLATVGSVDYVGEAAIGSATSTASWRVKKVDSTTGISITWAGSGVFDQVWDNYASLSYS